jgi:hypothetical protein
MLPADLLHPDGIGMITAAAAMIEIAEVVAAETITADKYKHR